MYAGTATKHIGPALAQYCDIGPILGQCWTNILYKLGCYYYLTLSLFPFPEIH